MPALNATKLTLLDWAKRLDPDGKTAVLAELLSQRNEVLQDLIFKEGNLPTGSVISIRTGLPTVYWRSLNAGVQSSKSTSAQITEGCGILEAYSELDADLAELNGNDNAFRLSESVAFLEAMNQEFVQTLFYGNVGLAQNEFNGLSIRYSSLSATNGRNILSGSGSSGNSSIWLLGHGENTIHGIFPKGSKAGLQHDNLGKMLIQATGGTAGAKSMCYVDRYQWKAGIALKDWRYVVRIANINIANLVAKASAADLVELMIKAIYRLPNRQMCTPVFYMNRTCFEMLDIQRRDDVQSGGQLKYEQVDGMMVPMFRGIPIRIVDQLVETEAAVA